MGNECSQWWLSSEAPIWPIIVMDVYRLLVDLRSSPEDFTQHSVFSGNQAGSLVQPEPLKVLSEAQAHQELFVRLRLE